MNDCLPVQDVTSHPPNIYCSPATLKGISCIVNELWQVLELHFPQGSFLICTWFKHQCVSWPQLFQYKAAGLQLNPQTIFSHINNEPCQLTLLFVQLFIVSHPEIACTSSPHRIKLKVDVSIHRACPAGLPMVILSLVVCF